MLVGVWSLCVKCTLCYKYVHKSSASAPVCCVHFVLHYVHNGAPGQCGRDNAIAGGDTVSTLRKTHNDDGGEFARKLYGNH